MGHPRARTHLVRTYIYFTAEVNAKKQREHEQTLRRDASRTITIHSENPVCQALSRMHFKSRTSMVSRLVRISRVRNARSVLDRDSDVGHLGDLIVKTRSTIVGYIQVGRAHPVHLETYCSPGVCYVVQSVGVRNWPLTEKRQDRGWRAGGIFLLEVHTGDDPGSSRTAVLLSKSTRNPTSIWRGHIRRPNS